MIFWSYHWPELKFWETMGVATQMKDEGNRETRKRKLRQDSEWKLSLMMHSPTQPRSELGPNERSLAGQKGKEVEWGSIRKPLSKCALSNPDTLLGAVVNSDSTLIRRKGQWLFVFHLFTTFCKLLKIVINLNRIKRKWLHPCTIRCQVGTILPWHT